MVSNGQQAVAATWNDAFLSRTADSSTVARITLASAHVDSGATIANTQRYINEVADSDGTVGEGDANRKVYSSNNYITNGDSRKVAIGKLDQAAADLSVEISEKVPKFIDNPQTVNNNEATPQTVTDLAFVGASHTSAIINYEVRRKTDSTSKIAVGRLFAYRQPDTGVWVLEVGDWFGQDAVIPGGLTFTILQTVDDAVVQYISDNLAGANYEGTIKTSVEYFLA